MHNYITDYQLINFQSWDDKTEAIPLATDVVNIIEGANETGKSVLYKVLYNFAFPGYWEPKELIRRGCDSGVLLLVLSSGDKIIFELEAKHHTYILVSQETQKVWNDCPLPQEIIDILGLVLDYEQKIILNVIDKDISLPFIKTSPKFNAGLIKARVEPPDITNYFQNTDELLQQIAEARSRYTTKTVELKGKADAIKYTDVSTLLEKKELIDTLLPVATEYSTLEQELAKLQELLGKCPTAVKDPSVVEPELNMHLALQELNEIINRTATIQKTKPSPVKSPEICDNLIEGYDSIQAFIRQLSEHIKHLAGKPKPVSCPDLDAELYAVKTINFMLNCIDDLSSRSSQIESTKNNINTTLQELERIREEVGVCPTCGRLLEAHS